MAPITVVGSTAYRLSVSELETIVSFHAREGHRLRSLGRDPMERSGVRILQTVDYDVWLLRWPPGTRVTPHDHGDSAGAFAVLEGELLELRWQTSLPECRLVTPGMMVSFKSGVVHDVVAANQVAYSVHAYSPPLETMSFYDMPVPSSRADGPSDAGRDRTTGYRHSTLFVDE